MNLLMRTIFGSVNRVPLHTSQFFFAFNTRFKLKTKIFQRMNKGRRAFFVNCFYKDREHYKFLGVFLFFAFCVFTTACHRGVGCPAQKKYTNSMTTKKHGTSNLFSKKMRSRMNN